jgi:hypothetical protein
MREQAKILKNESDPVPSDAAKFLFAKTGHVFAFMVDMARGRAVEATKEIKKGAFS